jgi:hypothetical protein
MHLAGAHLGSDLETARTWLVLDTIQHICYLALPNVARLFLERQWTRGLLTPRMEFTPDELGRLIRSLNAPSSQTDRQAQWEEELREQQANYRLLQRWLEMQPE